MKLYIKYMVSQRCKMMVERELDKLDIKHFAADLGCIETIEDISDRNRHLFSNSLLQSGLELLTIKNNTY